MYRVGSKMTNLPSVILVLYSIANITARGERQ